MATIKTMGCALALHACLAAAARVDAVGNVLSDPGFESLDGTAPDADTWPWFTVNEGQPGSFVSSTE